MEGKEEAMGKEEGINTGGGLRMDNGMGEKVDFWNRYERFWKLWGVFMGVMVISRLLRGLGLYPGSFDSSLMIYNVMWAGIQILCVFLSLLLLFEFVKSMKEMLRVDV